MSLTHPDQRQRKLFRDIATLIRRDPQAYREAGLQLDRACSRNQWKRRALEESEGFDKPLADDYIERSVKLFNAQASFVSHAIALLGTREMNPSMEFAKQVVVATWLVTERDIHGQLLGLSRYEAWPYGVLARVPPCTDEEHEGFLAETMEAPDGVDDAVREIQAKLALLRVKGCGNGEGRITIDDMVPRYEQGHATCPLTGVWEYLPDRRSLVFYLGEDPEWEDMSMSLGVIEACYERLKSG